MWNLFLSIRYFLARRKEGMISLIGVISVLGIALGVASLIIVLSVMNGFDIEVKKKIVGTYAHVIVAKENGIEDHDALISRMKFLPEIKNGAGFVTGQAILRKNEEITGILLKGIDEKKEPEVTRMLEYTAGASRKLTGGTIIPGSELMKNQRIAAGDTVDIIVPFSDRDIKKTPLKVIGSFTSGRYDYDANMAIVNLDTARELFGMGERVTGIGLRLEDEMTAGSIKTQLQSMLRYPYIVKSWMDLDRNLVAAFALEKKMMFIILALIVMVASFNIFSSLIMMVMEKTRDIGILKAIGANSRGISLIFLLEGAVIGTFGTVAGGVAGLFLAGKVNTVADFIERVTGMAVFPSDVYYFTEIPVRISVPDVCMVIFVAVLLTLTAGIYPAWKASRLDPVEAIRYE